MISTSVRVIAVQGRVAQVQPMEQSGCGACLSRESCGISGLGKYFSAQRKAIEVPCARDLRAGEEATVQMEEGDLLMAGALAYLLPCVLALIGAAMLESYGDLGAVLGAVLGGAIGFVAVRYSGWAPRLIVQSNPNQGETS